MITAKVFDTLPKEAELIRKTVFMDEQGFKDEFDDIDSKAFHIVLFSDNEPAATCRVFFDESADSYVLGRLAVMKQFRRQSLGAKAVAEAEKLAASKGGRSIVLHAQCRVSEFYEKQGYVRFGETDYDEGCEHIWMKKNI